MSRIYRYPIVSIAVSLLILIAASLVIDKAYGNLSESLTVIRQARQIENSSGAEEEQLPQLEERLAILESKWQILDNMKSPDLESLNGVAQKFNLRITGVNLKDQKKARAYSVIFSGNLPKILDALNHIENNFLASIESLSLSSEEKNPEMINLTLQIAVSE